MVAVNLLTSRNADSNPVSEDQPSSSQHTYGTRTRKRSIIRPSLRLRQSPESSISQRKLKSLSNIRARPVPAPPEPSFPVFPPPNVILHSDDASNKVLMAIGRSFLSVDNRAMTIKDLADMCMNFGLVCQSASAAGQAITSFIRSHMQRCELEQDQPLLLKHVLTGTPSDDHLVPALHSRSGGAHCTLTAAENRSTNFRRGTMIWYLSKAAGAPCPFARAGIRLSSHKIVGEPRQDPNCGQKRKRFLRARSSGRDNSDSESAISDSEQRLPKVKLTLRLKPPRMVSDSSTVASTPPSNSFSDRQSSASIIDLSKDSDSDDDSMSVDDSDDYDPQTSAKPEESIFPPYPRQSISIPAYTPSVEDLYPDLFRSPNYCPPELRSPSVPRSIASPPPDSDDDDDDFADTLVVGRCHSSARLRPSLPKPSFGFSQRRDEVESETVYESPVPRSPWRFFREDTVIVKEETGDVGGILEAWENVDNVSGSKVSFYSTHVASDPERRVKSEEYSLWNLSELTYPDAVDDDSVIVKEEDVDNFIVLSSKGYVDDDLSLSSSLSAVEPSYLADYHMLADVRRHNEILWKDAELLGPDSVRSQDFEDGQWSQPRVPLCRTRAHTSPSLFSSSIHSNDISSSLRCTTEPNTSTLETAQGLTLLAEPPDPTVVYTIPHVSPAISVAQVDGISIYQLIVDSYPLLRRFDTDFVNLSRIGEYLRQPKSSLEPVLSAKDVIDGCPLIRGKWVALERARSFVGDCLLKASTLDLFLSEKLHEQFPPSVQALHHSYQHVRSCNQFGLPFRSMVEKTSESLSMDDSSDVSERTHWDEDDHLISVHPSLGINSIEVSVPMLQDDGVTESPLSPTEQEIFHSFCGSAEWDTPAQATAGVRPGDEDEVVSGDERACFGEHPRTLRRSKRVAEAMASKSCTRSGKPRMR